MKRKSVLAFFNSLPETLRSGFDYSHVKRLIYATDASVYREVPMAVCTPRNVEDVAELVRFASASGLPVIPRGAGTSLAGQVVGKGIVADISKYMNSILEVNSREKWARVQPGVVLDDLNRHLSQYGLFFGPETSSANRCVIGGMLGNNACGSRSLVYGTTRDHVISLKAVLSDGSRVEFSPLTAPEFEQKCNLDSLEGEIYRQTGDMLSNPSVRDEIRKEYPDPSIKRRNAGYALDLLIDSQPFLPEGEKFNFSRIIAGSEGTLAFVTEIKINLVPLPPPEKVVMCIHLKSIEEAFYANLVALRFSPDAVEMMDEIILSCTAGNIEQKKNRFFIKGDPSALLIVEFSASTRQKLMDKTASLEKQMRREGYGYHFPLVFGEDIKRVWSLRKAALGLLSNLPGDSRPVSVIEDTAVDVNKLPAYVSEFRNILSSYGKRCVFYAHIGSGELHLRPVLNLKDSKDVSVFRKLARDVALLVKKYGGSLSGEHGDGRLRGEFLPLVLGKNNYELLCRVKRCWDPENVFNPGKITGTVPMDTNLRYQPGKPHKEPATVFDFTSTAGILRAAEKCSGSGDCRKSPGAKGVMCPSYMATGDEYSTARARANIIREYLTNSDKKNRFDHIEILEVLDFCLMCKGCKTECPGSVDIAKLKSEFLQHYYDANGVPLRVRMIANIVFFNRLGSLWPGGYNFFLKNPLFSYLLKKMAGFAPQRNFPSLHETTLRNWAHSNPFELTPAEPKGSVILFTDEFTDYNDTLLGISAVRLLVRLGYTVRLVSHLQSGRVLISKGLLRKAREKARFNIMALSEASGGKLPVVGIEPSAILALRDEYPELAGEELEESALRLANSSFMIEEFINMEMERGKITKEKFTRKTAKIYLHGHCQQKAVSSTAPSLKILSFPENFSAREIPSGCCGMGGAFGYEKEHYELSFKIGELVLFPEIRSLPEDAVIAAPGTSCRSHILDGTSRKALHPAEILHRALL